MKLRRIASDFRVEETVDLEPGDSGAFAFYRLTKTHVGTLEAITALTRRMGWSRRQVAYGGLKDRHAETIQYITVFKGPRRGVEQTNLHLEYLGQTEEPMGPSKILGNRFVLVLRHMHDDSVERARQALEELGTEGIPNYFDDQRFGSVGKSGEFIARRWIDEDWEGALKLALTDPNRHDRPPDKHNRAVLVKSWGDWQEAKSKLSKSHARSIITYLCDHPNDFRGAFGVVSRDLRGLWLSAFQSHLWNRWLAAELETAIAPDLLVPVNLRLFQAPFVRRLDAALRSTFHDLQLPFPQARAEIDDPDRRARLDAVLSEFGVTLERMKIRIPRTDFFSRGSRAAFLVPRDVRHHVGDDDMHPGKRKLELSFVLDRGSYATLVVKRVTDATRR